MEKLGNRIAKMSKAEFYTYAAAFMVASGVVSELLRDVVYPALF